MPFTPTSRCLYSSTRQHARANLRRILDQFADARRAFRLPSPRPRYNAHRRVLGPHQPFGSARAYHLNTHQHQRKLRRMIAPTLGVDPFHRNLSVSLTARRDLVEAFEAAARVVPREPPHKYRLTTEELRNLVDVYTSQDETRTQSHESGQLVTDSRTTSEQDGGVKDQMIAPTEESVKVHALKALLDNEDSSHAQVFNLYRSLPEPRMAHLPWHICEKLLDHMSQVEYATEQSMLRYLSIVEDVRAAGRRIKLSHWNSVISFIGTCVKRISAERLEEALDVWRDMESEAGIRADHVTFNILFDVATKSGKFALAGMIYDEMKARNVEYTRYFRTSLIYHHGLRGDGDGVRKAYFDLVEAGEIVDTVVINCVIASFLHCGEATSAEMTFERAKQLHAAKTNQPLPPQHWRERRRLGRRLEQAGRARRWSNSSQDKTHIVDGPFSQNFAVDIPRASDTEAGTHDDIIGALTEDNIDEETSIAPDLRTYKVFIYYHAITAGDIDRVATLVDEMEHYNVAVHGSIFLYLFKAFGRHGGILYTQWTVRRLENTWESYLKAVDADGGAGEVYASRAAAMLVTKAFVRCVSAGRAAEVWADLRMRMPESDLDEDFDHQIANYAGNDVDLFWKVFDWKMGYGEHDGGADEDPPQH